MVNYVRVKMSEMSEKERISGVTMTIRAYDPQLN